MNTYDICIIGGGASGMAAAIAAAAANPEVRVAIAEKKGTLGKKLAATGNGRCNITNTDCSEYAKTEAFLRSIGIFTREEAEGRVYPYSGQAEQVVSAFVSKLNELGTDIFCGETAVSVSLIASAADASEKGKTGEKNNNVNGQFVFLTEMLSGRTIASKKLIIACGGKASPQYGTSGDGYACAKAFGHKVTRLAPVLAPITLESSEYDGRLLKGIRTRCTAALIKDGRQIAEERGEVQFTEEGVSGIAVFNLSRFLKIEDGETLKEGMKRYSIALDLMPDYEVGSIIRLLIERQKTAGSVNLLRTIIDDRLAKAVLERAAAANLKSTGAKAVNMKTVNISEPCDIEYIEDTARALKCLTYTVTGTGGWKAAQCTAGGISLDEIDENTGESKLRSGLYFAGEILDYDGPCGGFNLQNAWMTGIKAGKDAALDKH